MLRVYYISGNVIMIFEIRKLYITFVLHHNGNCVVHAKTQFGLHNTFFYLFNKMYLVVTLYSLELPRQDMSNEFSQHVL